MTTDDLMGGAIVGILLILTILALFALREGIYIWCYRRKMKKCKDTEAERKIPDYVLNDYEDDSKPRSSAWRR